MVSCHGENAMLGARRWVERQIFSVEPAVRGYQVYEMMNYVPKF